MPTEARIQKTRNSPMFEDTAT